MHPRIFPWMVVLVVGMGLGWTMNALSFQSATPPAAERRLRCHSDGWNRLSPNIAKTRTSRTLSMFGITLRKNLRGMSGV